MNFMLPVWSRNYAKFVRTSWKVERDCSKRTSHHLVYKIVTNVVVALKDHADM